ncbi:MAG: PD-(D/E)XK nuclease family protein, partial [Desulfuromonadales bacterium]|nr:PD-(D/E)XK nuclease family protein [Desulfuromonadales bacterium]
MQDDGCTVWPTPQIISYEAWLHRCLSEAGEGWRLLSASAAQRLWEELIEQSSSGSEMELLQVPATARKAYEAHRLLGAYRCRLEDASLTEDQQVFRKWQERFLQVCRDKEWIDRAELPWKVLDILAASEQAVPGEVLLVG